MKKLGKFFQSNLILHIISGKTSKSVEGKRTLKVTRLVSSLINGDKDSSIRIVVLEKTSDSLTEKIIAAADTVSFVQVPGTVAKVDEVAPFLINGVILVGSGGKSQQLS